MASGINDENFSRQVGGVLGEFFDSFVVVGFIAGCEKPTSISLASANLDEITRRALQSLLAETNVNLSSAETDE